MLSLQTFSGIIVEITENGGSVCFTDQTTVDDVLNVYEVTMERGGNIAVETGGTIPDALEAAYDRFTTTEEGAL